MKKNNTFNLAEELQKLPDQPGVYLMKNDDDEIIYVGKAKILKNRVRQYFQKNKQHSVKVLKMVENIASFEYIVTNNEVEALILENNLIKKYDPHYNILLKDDKTYPYIKVSVNEMFPRVTVTRRHLKDKAKYFGPYTSGLAVKESIELIHRLYPIRSCQKSFPRDTGKERPCLNYHIGKCKAPCNNMISREEYDSYIEKVLDFLNGKTKDIIAELTEKMETASENLEFEQAAEYRDIIGAVKKVSERQIIENMAENNRDVIAFVRENADVVFQVFFIRGGVITGRESFMPECTPDTDDTELMTDFVKQFYSGTPYIPKEIILQCDIDDFDLISSWLSQTKGQRVNILVPQKGERHNLVNLAKENAKVVLERTGNRLKREYKQTLGALEEIKQLLGLDFDLNRIESYDISNTQGFQNIGAMVVFEQGKPKRSDYRKFKIKSVIGADDYASMEEVITRRFTRYVNENSGETQKTGFDKLPDAIFTDGGKGQMKSVQTALDNVGVNVLVCGMVKDDRHRTRGLIYNGKEYIMSPHSEAFKLITRIQDEVHRFAIEYHRKLRAQKQIHSILDDIPEIGEKRRKALMAYFGDINAIKAAEVDELAKADGMTAKAAEQVYNFFCGIK
ncbi:MAG: excinuclease ABC subunit UvrC [Firmicutes bacterium]|nr:excinuclease ABC subunit UvrC [Bacillota bacterium]